MDNITSKIKVPELEDNKDNRPGTGCLILTIILILLLIFLIWLGIKVFLPLAALAFLLSLFLS